MAASILMLKKAADDRRHRDQQRPARPSSVYDQTGKHPLTKPMTKPVNIRYADNDDDKKGRRSVCSQSDYNRYRQLTSDIRGGRITDTERIELAELVRRCSRLKPS